MHTISIAIDGLDAGLPEVYPFYQDIPYPGDHTYKIAFIFDGVQALSAFTRRMQLDSPATIDWRIFFFQLAALWPEQEAGTALYLINNVQQVQVNDQSIVLSGLCSSVARKVVP